MSNWEETYTPKEEINNGNEYKDYDGLTAKDINAISNNALYGINQTKANANNISQLQTKYNSLQEFANNTGSSLFDTQDELSNLKNVVNGNGNDIETLQEKTAGVRTNEDGEAVFDGGMRAYNRIELNGEIYSSIVPSNNYSYNLGEDGYAWKDTYTNNLTVYNKVKSNLTPNEDLMYNLGSNVKSWKNIYSKQIFLDGIQAINGDSIGNSINIGSDDTNGDYPEVSFFDGKIRMNTADEILNIRNDSTDYYKFKVEKDGTSSFKFGRNDVNITAPNGFILNGHEIERRLIEYEEKCFHFLQSDGTNEIMTLCTFSEERTFEHLRNIHVFYNRYRRVCEFTIPKICFENDKEIRIDNVNGDTYFYWVLTYDSVNNKITMETDDDGEYDEYIYVTVTYRMKY